MNDEKTCLEWLKEIPDEEIRALAIERYDPGFAGTMDDLTNPSIRDAVYWAFDWRKSPEGRDFWAMVTDWLAGHTLKPDIPQTEAVHDVKKAAGDAKPQLWLMPPAAEEAICAVLKHGADKYGVFNWRKSGVKVQTYISAMKRHMAAVHRGEWLDQSGQPHIAHIAASCVLMLDADEHGKLDKEVV